MKKIYSLLAMMMIASVTFAQTFTVTVNGKSVNNGDLVQINHEVYPVHWIVPNVVGTYNLEPEINIVADAKQTITVTASDDIKDGVLQNCAFGQCISVTATNCPVSAQGTIEAGETDAAIHLTYGSKNPGADLQRSFNVEISNGSKTIAFTVQYNIGKYVATSISNIATSIQNAPVYTIGGVKTDESNIPNGKVFIKGGKKYIKK